MDEIRATAAVIAARCLPQANQIARQIVADQHAALRDLPSDMRDVEIAATARHGIRLFLALAQGHQLTGADMQLFRDRTAQRVDEGVQLRDLMTAYYIGYRVIWETLCAATRPGEEEALRYLATLQLNTLEILTATITEAYLAEQSALMSERRETLRTVAHALISGRHDQATRYDVELTPPYHVIAIRISTEKLPTDQPTRAVATGQAIMARRTMRSVQREFDALAGHPVLTLLDGQGGHALLPAQPSIERPLARLSTRLETSLGAPVRLALAHAPTLADIQPAATQTTRVAAITEQNNLPSGVYGIRDVLLDYHLSTPGDSADELTALLAPLDEQLLETLNRYLACDFDRRRTAADLGVHANTIDNRLTRVRDLTGIDLRTAQGILLCGAALTVRRLTR
ncbi:transcriptional regulator [Acrocarpospora pleiomorpha]|uniref:Transcriptional regulator n=1 Tax=Acrocarpospora pleiomorpha TaxID=90975 RepID=A0A5M3XTM5_9ACTN|nr:helix-turn-helix domain-containing protein [Acrocarpospora pleiomorpha]GES23339.1 transcriptional regulator [Acrocarpospora pleiomorpha]